MGSKYDMRGKNAAQISKCYKIIGNGNMGNAPNVAFYDGKYTQYVADKDIILSKDVVIKFQRGLMIVFTIVVVTAKVRSIARKKRPHNNKRSKEKDCSRN